MVKDGKKGLDGFRVQISVSPKIIHTFPIKPPKYYIPHILSQINLVAEDPVDEAVFLSWSEEPSTAFHFTNGEDILEIMEMGMT